jgi:Phytanoyl-CoA dioxygenase (PhyH)
MSGTGLSEIFSASKGVQSRALNRAGVQPFRAVSARLIYRIAAAGRAGELDDLLRRGFLIIEDFLPPEEFMQLRNEAAEFAELGPPTWVHKDGASRCDRWNLPPDEPYRFPRLTTWTHQTRLIDLASAAEQQALRPHEGMRVLEYLHIGDPSLHDEQTDLHVDAPFNTHKLWLYLDDVTPDHAPFVYVPMSHKLDWVRLRGDYLESTRNNVRSRRIGDEELRRRGLETVVVTCPRNTLVLANTCGYHCRSAGAHGATRRSLHMMLRSNPFSIRHRFRRWTESPRPASSTPAVQTSAV